MCLAALLLAGAAEGATLRIGLNEDPDALDPARGGSFVGRVVFAAVCDKLIDIDAQEQFRAAACHHVGLVGGQSDADRDAARRREVPRRPGDGRRRGEGQPGALPHRAGEPAQGRAEAGVVGGGGRSAHGAAASVAALRAAGRRAGGSRRHDDLAQGARPRRHAGPAVRRPVQADRARRAGPHRGGSLRRLLERRRDQAGSHRLPAAARYHGAAGQPAGRTARHGGAARADRRRDGEEEPEAEADQPAGAGLLLDEHQPGRAGQPAEGPARARGAGSFDRSRRAQPGGVRRPVHSVEPVRGAGQPLLGPRPSRSATRPGQGEGAAEGGRAGASTLHAADRQQSGGAAGRPGGAVDGGRGGLRRQAAGRGGECAGRGRTLPATTRRRS